MFQNESANVRENDVKLITSFKLKSLHKKDNSRYYGNEALISSAVNYKKVNYKQKNKRAFNQRPTARKPIDTWATSLYKFEQVEGGTGGPKVNKFEQCAVATLVTRPPPL